MPHSFCASGWGTRVKVLRCVANDCGAHGVISFRGEGERAHTSSSADDSCTSALIKDLAGAKVEAKACRSTRNAMGGFVSFGLGACLSVEDSYSLKVHRLYTQNVKQACDRHFDRTHAHMHTYVPVHAQMRIHESLNPRIGKTGVARTLPDALP